MKTKKQHVIAPKKSDAKKNINQVDSDTKSAKPTVKIRKKLNEFGDTDSF